MNLELEFPIQPLINKVAVIKAIRMLTGMGLKEAKDVTDRLGTQTIRVDRSMFSGHFDPDKGIEEQCRIMRNEGVNVGASIHKLLQSLRDLGADALKQGEDELASEILQLVLAEKLRRTNA